MLTHGLKKAIFITWLKLDKCTNCAWFRVDRHCDKAFILHVWIKLKKVFVKSIEFLTKTG